MVRLPWLCSGLSTVHNESQTVTKRVTLNMPWIVRRCTTVTDLKRLAYQPVAKHETVFVNAGSVCLFLHLHFWEETLRCLKHELKQTT